jgi:hypothetical protein
MSFKVSFIVSVISIIAWSCHHGLVMITLVISLESESLCNLILVNMFYGYRINLDLDMFRNINMASYEVYEE